MSKIKLVAFDLDGTIGDTIPLCIRAFKKTVTPYIGHELSDDDVIQTFGLNEQGMIGSIIDTPHKERALEDFYTIYKNLHEQMCPRPFPGIRELITDLKQSGIIVALITGKGSKSCDITLQQFDMNTFEVVYVGDTIADIMACKTIGVDCLSAAWGVSEMAAQDLVRHNKNVFYDIPSLHNCLLPQ